jgi:hypothetical protein
MKGQLISMTFVRYAGFRPTIHYLGLVAWGRAVLGVQTGPDAWGFIIFGYWIGFIKNGNK